MRVFELEATFPASPPDEPDTLTYFVRSLSLDQAKARLKEFGGENIRLVRELSEEKTQQLRYFLGRNSADGPELAEMPKPDDGRNMRVTHRLATLADANRLFEIRRQSIIVLAPKEMSTAEAEAWASTLTIAGMGKKFVTWKYGLRK